MLVKNNSLEYYSILGKRGKMSKIVEKRGCLGTRKIIFYEDEEPSGEYTFINGDWIWSTNVV